MVITARTENISLLKNEILYIIQSSSEQEKKKIKAIIRMFDS